jgi:hypothetical protein
MRDGKILTVGRNLGDDKGTPQAKLTNFYYLARKA